MAGAAEDQLAEVASILSIDLLGKGSSNPETRERLGALLRETMRFRIADVAGKVVLLPNDNNVTAAFFADAEAPLECATEVARGLANDSRIKWRMGIHSGRVQRSADEKAGS